MVAAIDPMAPGVLLAGGVTAMALGLWLLLPRGASGGRERAARWLGSLLGIIAAGGVRHHRPTAGEHRRRGRVSPPGRRSWPVSVGGGHDRVAVARLRRDLVCPVAGRRVGRAPFLVLGAGQFFGVATIVVYAGEILRRCSLFVLMLAAAVRAWHRMTRMSSPFWRPSPGPCCWGCSRSRSVGSRPARRASRQRRAGRRRCRRRASATSPGSAARLWPPPRGCRGRGRAPPDRAGRVDRHRRPRGRCPRREGGLADVVVADAAATPLIVGAILFSLGLIGILTRRNLIVMFLSAETMLQGIPGEPRRLEPS